VPWLTDTMFGLIYDRLASGIGDAAASLG